MLRGIRNFQELIKFQHAFFALLFAYVGMILATGAWPTWQQALWITVAMASARILVMVASRLADRVIAAQNQRTAARPMTSGWVSPGTAWVGSGWRP